MGKKLSDIVKPGVYYIYIHMYKDKYVNVCVCVYNREKEMATHSSILTWKIPWTEKPGRLQPIGSQRVRHD